MMQKLARHAKLTAVAVTLVALAALLPPPGTLWAQTLQVANSAADLAGKILMVANSTTPRTVSNLFTFDRSPSAPFAVTAASAKVTNLDADKLDGLDSLAFVKADGSVAMTGGLTLSAGQLTTAGQVVFPATQSASANANTLDDYEEGTWTPTIGGSGGGAGQAYTTQEGRYIKVGRATTIYGRIILSTLGTETTSVQIKSLPFAAAGLAYAPCYISFWSATTATFSYIAGVIVPSTSVIDLYGIKAAAVATSGVVQADLSNTTSFVFGCTYEAGA